METKPEMKQENTTESQTKSERELLLEILDAQRPAEAVRLSMDTIPGFEALQRAAKLLCASSLVPERYQGSSGLANAVIALEMASRLGAAPLMVMQNLFVVYGTPGWSAQFLIACVNTCGRFSALRYEWKGSQGQDDWGCRAWAIEKATGERLNGSWITFKIVKDQGWWFKAKRDAPNVNTSKWPLMTEQMFMYRAGAYWQRAYAPEYGMGLRTVEEVHDDVAVPEFTAPPLSSSASEPDPSMSAPTSPDADETAAILARAQEQLRKTVGTDDEFAPAPKKEREPGEEG